MQTLQEKFLEIALRSLPTLISKASWNATCHIHKPEGRICCKAMLASCLACPYGNGGGGGGGNTIITVADYCRCKPATAGCKP